MKNKFTKPANCENCKHYNVVTQYCKEINISAYMFDVCPVPTKIKAPDKDPNEEICERFLEFCGTDKIMDGRKYRKLMELLNHYRPVMVKGR